MALKKSEMYSSLWQSCDELRGGMDASQYKDYVLSLLFVKYVSPTSTPASHLRRSRCRRAPALPTWWRSRATRRSATASTRSSGAAGRGQRQPQGRDQRRRLQRRRKLGKGKEMVDRLTNLVAIFEGPATSASNRAEGDDLLGDAYEYLMRHFATESGKSKGQFYTPAEVSASWPR
jgi:type I restriction enzyme M protein